jgi:hypothetical protein
MHTPLILCALVTSGLAVILSREHRLRLAFQQLASQLLRTLRERATPPPSTHPRRRNP